MKYEITPEYDKRARSVFLNFLHIPSLSLDHLCASVYRRMNTSSYTAALRAGVCRPCVDKKTKGRR